MGYLLSFSIIVLLSLSCIAQHVNYYVIVVTNSDAYVTNANSVAGTMNGGNGKTGTVGTDTWNVPLQYTDSAGTNFFWCGWWMTDSQFKTFTNASTTTANLSTNKIMYYQNVDPEVVLSKLKLRRCTNDADITTKP